MVARIVYKSVFASLGLDDEYIEKSVPGIPREVMAVNYFPNCPDPSLTLGLSGHSDVGCLTVLHPSEVPGLQIKHKGAWIPVVPIHEDAFIVNLADQVEVCV
jgi:isopenicillin N synthase-like dioxygenase